MASYLVDTNVLLRLVQRDDHDYVSARSAVLKLLQLGNSLFYTSQNLAEFWNTCTRPSGKNGLGLTIPEVDSRARLIESELDLLTDTESSHWEFRRLLVARGVMGVKVHDARLVAAMLVHRVPNILTFNTRDFVRYSQIEAISPEQIVSRAGENS